MTDINTKRFQENCAFGAFSQLSTCAVAADRFFYDFICIVQGSEDRRTEASRDLVTSSQLDLDALGELRVLII